jgi:hypothetical protein
LQTDRWFKKETSFEVEEMNRQEATNVLRELIVECDGMLLLSCVSLSHVKTQNPNKTEDYEMYISCGINERLRRTMTAVLDRHQLVMKEKNSGSGVIIFRPSHQNE